MSEGSSFTFKKIQKNLHQEEKVLSEHEISRYVWLIHVGIKMNTKDFNFLYRKEILILFCFLITITFSQIGLEKNIRFSEIPTLAVLNNPLLEALGLVLPLFVSAYLIFSHLSKAEVSWLPPRKWIITFSLIYLLIDALVYA